jgi:hypothetical protein
VSAPNQSFAHHVRLVPPFHFGVLPILAVNLLWCLYQLFQVPSWPTVLSTLMALAFIGMAIYGRNFALAVQDRLIRLEMRLRLERLLAADLKARIPELSVSQLVGLRFAADDELPALAREVLEQRITDRKEIKRRVKSWQADHQRA